MKSRRQPPSALGAGTGGSPLLPQARDTVVRRENQAIRADGRVSARSIPAQKNLQRGPHFSDHPVFSRSRIAPALNSRSTNARNRSRIRYYWYSTDLSAPIDLHSYLLDTSIWRQKGFGRTLAAHFGALTMPDRSNPCFLPPVDRSRCNRHLLFSPGVWRRRGDSHPCHVPQRQRLPESMERKCIGI